MTTWVETDIKDILYGATLLGAGGGGALRDGLRLLSEVAEKHDVKLEVIQPEDMKPGEYAVMVAGIGAPKAMEEKDFGPEAIYAYEMMEKIAFLGGKPLKYIMAGELGGFNTMVPMYVAILNNIPFVNGDGNGRAVPELSTGLYPAFNIPPTPLVLAGSDGNTMVAYLDDPEDHKSAENIARHISMAYGMSAAFCTWIVDGTDITEKLAPKSIERCRVVGSAINNARKANRDIVEELKKVDDCTELFRGTIKDVEVKTEGGFDFGTTTISGTGKYQGETITIDFKNENLLVRDKSGKVLVTVPELITTLNLDNGQPLTNAETEAGQNIAVIGIPAPENWWKKPEGFTCWTHILEKVGYTGGSVRLT
ncbi:MAG: DUF917 domain-containing protein [Firmicutes bacterium]|nr:DUF917 domain-containing protein [Bacillota bacterium]